MIVQEYFDYSLSIGQTESPFRKYVIFLGYALRPLLLLFFCYLFYPEGYTVPYNYTVTTSNSGTQYGIVGDEWTWLMVLIFALSLLTDVIFFRYRGERPPEED